ncbi:serine/threonine-protein kinase [Spirillospora sp. CA-294931]|uniref:serine/threonine-protein kinase n=1 Tax=Spirillospora sp. CA-294931 TaxID=3240042 RepID=UPI003D8F3B85
MGEGRLLANRYRLDAVVGRGGMGTVWRAYDVTLDREVAIKEVLLPPGLTPSEQDVLYQRTFREARASARLSHPGVVIVHDVVEEEDRPWIVMELVLAKSLQDLLDDGPMDHRRVAEIGLQMLAALRHAHEKGILHRDIKPSNVLITDAGRVVLTDFGIAQVEGDATLTQTGLVMGSPAYIPPERAQGERAVPASDLWALGATLYAALEGHSPYERSDAMASLQAALSEPVPPARNAGPLGPVLDGLLVREPAWRMTGPQAQPLLSRVATMPVAEETVFDRTVTDDPARGIRRVDDDHAATVLDSAELDVTIRDPGPVPEAKARPGPDPDARTLRGGDMAAEWTVQPPPQAPVSHHGPQTPPPWEQPQHVSQWQQPPPPQHTHTGGRERERRRTIVIVIVAVVLVVAAVLAGAFILRGKLNSGASGRATTVVRADGYSVEVPRDWARGPGPDGRNRLAAPDGQTWLTVDTTRWPPEVRTPLEQARVSKVSGPAGGRLPGYREIGVSAVSSYLGTSAADWEFTFTADGRRVRVRDRFVQLNGAPYALYFRAPEASWASVAGVRDRIFATFQVSSA